MSKELSFLIAGGICLVLGILEAGVNHNARESTQYFAIAFLFFSQEKK